MKRNAPAKTEYKKENTGELLSKLFILLAVLILLVWTYDYYAEPLYHITGGQIAAPDTEHVADNPAEIFIDSILEAAGVEE